MQVMLLAAGRSTRLGSLGALLPKPLAPVCGHPAIAFGLALCRRAGLEDVVINAHHHADLLREALGDGAAYGVRIRWSVEEELLGTGGGLVRARPLFAPGPVLIINGKILIDFDLRALVEAHREAPPGALATMVLREDPQPDRFAPVGVDATGHVVSLRGQRTDRTPVGPIAQRMFTGLHVVEPALLDRLPDGVSDVIADAYIPALVGGARIHSLLATGFFADPSTPERYLEANLALLANPSLIPHPPGPLVGVDPGAHVAADARIVMPARIASDATVEPGATIGPLAVVCAGARVKRGARVERSVVWPGAVAEGLVSSAIATPQGLVAAAAV